MKKFTENLMCACTNDLFLIKKVFKDLMKAFNSLQEEKASLTLMPQTSATLKSIWETKLHGLNW